MPVNGEHLEQDVDRRVPEGGLNEAVRLVWPLGPAREKKSSSSRIGQIDEGLQKEYCMLLARRCVHCTASRQREVLSRPARCRGGACGERAGASLATRRRSGGASVCMSPRPEPREKPLVAAGNTHPPSSYVRLPRSLPSAPWGLRLLCSFIMKDVRRGAAIRPLGGGSQ